METMRILLKGPVRRPRVLGALLDRSRKMEREISSVFDRLFGPGLPFRPMAETRWHPFTDIYESPSQVLVRMEVAGVDPASLDVVKDGRCLVVTGMRAEPPWGEAIACHQLEISYGMFERVVCLPADFGEDRVRAEYASNGFLHITVAKD